MPYYIKYKYILDLHVLLSSSLGDRISETLSAGGLLSERSHRLGRGTLFFPEMKATDRELRNQDLDVP